MTLNRIIKLLTYMASLEMDAHFPVGTQSETEKAIRHLEKMRDNNDT